MSESSKDASPSLAFKADFFPLTVIRLTDISLPKLKKMVKSTLKDAPNYFSNAPIVVDVNDIETQEQLPLSKMKIILKESGMILIGIRGLNPAMHQDAIDLDIAVMKNTRPPKSEPARQASKPTTGSNKTKIITKPIRAGSQVYAKGGDLVILAAVNAGAECFADGNIHVYGPVRGKVLAGATGDKTARIFCESLDAELVSIAGQYLIHEQIVVPDNAKSMIQISLIDDKLSIKRT